MEKFYTAFTTVGAAAVIVGGFFSLYQLYRLVQVDAECRGLKHPKLWGAFAASGNNSSGLLLYLIGRRKYPVQSMTREQKELMEKRKRKIGTGLIFLAAGAIVCVLSLLLTGQL